MLHAGGLLLLAAVGGYWVLERAEAHKGRLKQTGQLLGTIIIVVSLIGLVCHVWNLATCKGISCPMTFKHMRSGPPPTP